MQITVTGRKIDVTDALRRYAEEKAQKIEKYFKRIKDVHIVLSVEKYRHKAEVTINANGVILHGAEVTEDMYSSIDKVMDKLEQQVKRYKSKLKTAKTKKDSGNGFVLEASDNALISEKEKGDITASLEQNMAIKPQIIRKKGVATKPMLPEEAIMQLNMVNNDFLVFINARNEQINVIYKRKDGNYGLIEPE